MSRTRSRSIGPGVAWQLYRNGTLHSTVKEPLFYLTEYSPWTTSKRGNLAVETMVDELSTSNSYRDVHPVTHQKMVLANLSQGPVVNYYYPTGGPSEMLGFVPTVQCAHFEPSISGFPTLSWPSLVTQLASQIDSGIETSSLLFVTLAEMRKTIQMVRNPFNLLRRDWRKTAGNHSLHHLLKMGANVWLEAQYGWKSAYYDMVNFAKSYRSIYANFSNIEPDGFERFSVSQIDYLTPGSWQYHTGTGSDWNAVLSSGSLTWRPSSGGYIRARSHGAKRIARLGCERLIDIRSRISHSLAFQRALGIDANSILPTLWELVPMSFVIDWFVDTRGLWCLPALNRLNRADVRRLCYSVKTISSAEMQFLVGYPFSGMYSLTGGYTPLSRSSVPVFHGDCTSTIYTRSVGGPPISDITNGLLSANLSTTQLASGLSLIIQRLHR